APVRNALDSAPARRFFQFLRYAEKELGAEWPELLDQLAGGGIALAFQFGADPAPAMLVIQGTDEKQTAKAFDLLLRIVEEELARQGAKERPVRREYNGVATTHIGDA